MTHANPWQSYREVATTTAPPGHLVLMLYDGAIRFLNGALAGFQLEDPLEFHQTINNNILRAQDIVNELNASLDMNLGGELSDRLRGLYLYFDRRLQESNAQKEPAGVSEVVARLTVLRTAWAEMLVKPGIDSAPLIPSPPGQTSLEAIG